MLISCATAPSNIAGPGRKRRRQEKKWERDALRDDEYVEQLEEKAKRRRKLPEVRAGMRSEGTGCLDGIFLKK